MLNDSTFVPQAMEIARPVAQFDVIGEAKQVYDWVQAPHDQGKTLSAHGAAENPRGRPTGNISKHHPGLTGACVTRVPAVYLRSAFLAI